MKNAFLIFVTACVPVVFFSLRPAFSVNDEWPVPDKYVKMKNPYASSADAEQIGKKLYAIHCKSCHGIKGKGDGTKAVELKTKVPDFTAAGFKAESDGSVYYKAIFGKAEMPGFDKKITAEEDRWLLVNFIKKF